MARSGVNYSLGKIKPLAVEPLRRTRSGEGIYGVEAFTVDELGE